MQTHTSDPVNQISVLGFLTNFEMACDANRIYERAPIWALLSFNTNRVAPTNSQTVQIDGTKRLATKVNSNGAALQAIGQMLYFEVVDHLLKRDTNGEAPVKADAALLHFIQPAITKTL